MRIHGIKQNQKHNHSNQEVPSMIHPLFLEKSPFQQSGPETRKSTTNELLNYINSFYFTRNRFIKKRGYKGL